MNKAFYMVAEYQPGKGVGQIPPTKIGDAVKTIKDYGCDTLLLGYADPTPPTAADLSLQEPCDAAGIELRMNCEFHGWTPPTMKEAIDPQWYIKRFNAWVAWLGGRPAVWDGEFYRHHPWNNFRNADWTDAAVQEFRKILQSTVINVDWFWAFGGQNALKMGYAFDVLATNLVGTDGEYDDAAGAWKDHPAHTIPANPAKNQWPSWFDKTKIKMDRLRATKDGAWVKNGSVWQKSWAMPAVAKGILYSPDSELLANLGL